MSKFDEKAGELLKNAALAAGAFEMFDQEKTDRIVEEVYKAGFDARISLAHMACEETGLGVFEHKVIKNVLSTQVVYEDIKNEKTVGIISEDEHSGITEIAQPLGPVLAVIPVTNPTSTVMFKILISLKTRNPIIISPSPRAAKCCSEAARICYEAALRADAPEYCVQWIEEPAIELTQALMAHRGIAMILATGGPGLVKAAYSSGTPALGVGPGNVPVFIDESADIPYAVRTIILSKTFDNGTICASEQAIVVEQKIADRVRSEFKKQKCYFLNPDETAKVEKVAVDPKTGLMSPSVVGQPVEVIASLAGISVPPETKIIIAEQEGVGAAYPLSGEVLAPILAFYVREDLKSAIKTCIELNYLGGLGHTASIYANNDERVNEFAAIMSAGRIVVNTPSAQGAVGGIFNDLHPSFTLGCGTWGKNITTENITAHHLLNIKRICRRRDNLKWSAFPTEKYFDESLSADDLLQEFHKNY
jgi:acetaldehyde dehydrogenase / alcohol dehydrogenase